MPTRRLSLAILLFALSCVAALPVRADIESLQKDFQTPPPDARIMVRWWWFGPAVTKAGIERELNAMKAGGIGGVELQTTYPLALDGGSGDTAIKNLKFLSPEYLDMIGFAAAKCKELGLRMDLTLGSGWPYGGPMFSAAEGAGALETAMLPAPAGQTSVTLPPLRPGRTVLAAFAGPAGSVNTGRGRGGGGGGGGEGGGNAAALKEIPIQNGAAQLPADFPGGEVVFFISGRTGMQVKRPALGAEGNVIDHLSPTVVEKFIQKIAEPQIKACGPNPPYAIFCDSLEVAGENWTDGFLAEFQNHRGYDLTPYLPALVGNIGDTTAAIRHDYAQTVTDLFNERFNARFQKLAQQYHTRFRVQGYGSPPAGLLSYAFADLPEGEGGGNGNWRSFRTTRYASSASHLMNQKITSSETFTWLHQAPFRATPLDIKGEVDTHFLDGINQIICHGWPYTGNGAADPGWSFYAAAVFDEKNPWYIAMPEISGYMQRVSQMLREGTPANDVALYLPDSDVWSRAAAGYSSMNTAFTNESGVLNSILEAGYNIDAWDDGMLMMKGKVVGGEQGGGDAALVFGDVKYRIVVLPNVTYMPLDTARNLEAFARGGGLVVALQSVPAKVPGFKATDKDQEELRAIMQRMFKEAGAPGVMVSTGGNESGQIWPAQIAAALGKKMIPDVKLDPPANAIGFVHRHTDGGELYFLANTSNTPQSEMATFRGVDGLIPEMWNPLTGRMTQVPVRGAVGASMDDRRPRSDTDGTTIALDLPPYGSTIIVWSTRVLHSTAQPALAPTDLSAGWSVKFDADAQTLPLDKLKSWTDLPGKKNFSGVATYEKTFSATADMAKAAGLMLRLGAGAAETERAGRGGTGYAAELAAPVRDAAVVYINGRRAGAAWCPPFGVDVTGLIKEGDNQLRILVGNTAVNQIAANGFPNYDYNALRQAFGNRFQPQGQPLLAQPLPSGLLGPITLETHPR